MALVLACLTVSGALAKGRTHVLTGEGVYIHPGGFVDVAPGDIVNADSSCPAGYGSGWEEQVVKYHQRGALTQRGPGVVI